MLNKIKTYMDRLSFIPIVVLLVPFDYVTWNIIDYLACLPTQMNKNKKDPKKAVFSKSCNYRSWSDVVNSNWINHVCEI